MQSLQLEAADVDAVKPHEPHRIDQIAGAQNDELAEALRALIETISAVENDVRNSPSFGTDAEQAMGYRHLLRAFTKGIESEVIQNADFPYFRILDFWLKEGGDNPDQRYAFSPIKGGEHYRVWGELGSAARMELQIYAGRPWDGSGRSAGYLNFSEIETDEQGRFEIEISPSKMAGNWLRNPPEATTLFARHIYDEWNAEQTGSIHIDRVGYEGRRIDAETTAQLAEKIRSATTVFATSARTWPKFVNARYVDSRPVNTVAEPYDTYALGGAKGRWMSGGHFKLEADEVLLIRMPNTTAAYQAIQLTDMWFASLEYGNQVSSLTSKQSELADDDAYYYVIGPQEPGYRNWLDSGALSRGVFLLRWDGLVGELSDKQFPSAKLVKRESLKDLIPGYSVVDDKERQETRRMRRKHLQLRSNR